MKLNIKEKLRLRNAFGEWALITGVSSGIGFELASLLVDAGFNLVIISRNEDHLLKAEKQLLKIEKTKIIPIAADLSDKAGIDEIINKTKELIIGLIILSAGYGTSGLFIDNSIHTEINMLRVNCESVISLAHYFSQKMALKGRGGIILLSSMVAFQGTPYAANYAATKAFIQTFAEGIANELKPKGIDVLAAAPGPVKSSFALRANMKMNMALDPKEVGIPILKALGNKTTVIPGFLSKLLVYSLRTVTRNVKIKIMAKVMGGMTQHQRI